jgi:CRISPR/Cas system-associated endoribonuclease Cas2
MKTKQSELKSMVEKIIKKETDFIAIMKGNNNPQVLEMVCRSGARLELAEAVLCSIDGDNVLLKSYGGI